MLAYLFPGQGSQISGMGGQLFDEFPEFVAITDEILGYSIKTLCLTDPRQQLNQTQYTQPAIYVVNALTYFKKLQMTKQIPDYVCGHSLGEYNALLAAEVFDFATGLTLVKKRGELMSSVLGGAMAAIIGLPAEHLKQLFSQNDLKDVAIANYNSYTQLVISGSQQAIERASSVLESKTETIFIPLKVSGAFHSPHMSAIEKQYADFLCDFTFTIPSIPVIANVNAHFYHPAVIQSNLTNQLSHAVQWANTIEYLLEQNDIVFEEIGHGNVLQGLVRKIRNKQ